MIQTVCFCLGANRGMEQMAEKLDQALRCERKWQEFIMGRVRPSSHWSGYLGKFYWRFDLLSLFVYWYDVGEHAPCGPCVGVKRRLSEVTSQLHGSSSSIYTVGHILLLDTFLMPLSWAILTFLVLLSRTSYSLFSLDVGIPTGRSSSTPLTPFTFLRCVSISMA